MTLELAKRESWNTSEIPAMIFHGDSGAFYDCSLALCGDLLRTLERNERELEVVRSLLKGILLPGLVRKNVRSEKIATRERSTNKVELKSNKFLEVC